jgi:predicted permease
LPLISYLRALLAKYRHPGRPEDELAHHLELRAADLERQGLTPEAARRQARLEFGSVARFAEESRESLPAHSLDVFLQDIRYSFRVLRQSPGFAIVATLTLALAIAANTAAFAALNAIILKPLDLPRAESLFSIHRAQDNLGSFSYPSFRDIQQRNSSFEDLTAYYILVAGLDNGQSSGRDWVIAATGNYFDVLGVQPHLGRFFHASDEHGPNSAPYVVLSHAYWQSRFQSDPKVVGRKVLVNKAPFTILGVTPPAFHGTLLFMQPDYFVPLVNVGQLDTTVSLTSRATRWLFLSLGHLKPGVSPERAAAGIESVHNGYLTKTFPNDHSVTRFKLGKPGLYGDHMGAPARAFLIALVSLAALILLAACANLGSLCIARAADRNRELALRLALGASRARVLRQLLTEALLIALAGGALGLWGGITLLQALRAWRPVPQFPIYLPVDPDPGVYLLAAVLSVLSGLFFGAAPLRQILRLDPHDSIKAGTRSTSARRFALRDALVLVQIAICALLVTSSFVAVRGLLRGLASDFGFDPRQAVVAQTVLDIAGHRGEAIPELQKRLIAAAASIPGVTGAGFIDVAPLSNGSGNSVGVYREDAADLRPANALFTSAMYRISPGYLAAARTPLLLGRDVAFHDSPQSPKVAVVNREFAQRVFGSAAAALGRHFKLRDGTRHTIVGVVETGKYQTLTESPQPAVFFAHFQSPQSQSDLIVRSTLSTQELATALRAKVRALDPGLPVYIQSWDDTLSLVLFPSRVAAFSLGVLGAIGAVLSLTGIFGIAAYSVSRRMKELGIRMALGAQRREILSAALGRSLRVLGYGSLAGLGLGLLASQLLAYIVYQASPRDPWIMTGVVAVMLAIGIFATWIPARRALKLDPLVLLRED